MPIPLRGNGGIGSGRGPGMGHGPGRVLGGAGGGVSCYRGGPRLTHLYLPARPGQPGFDDPLGTVVFRALLLEKQ